MAIQVTNDTLRGLNTTVRAEYMKSYKSSEEQSWHKKVCALVPSLGASNTYPVALDPGEVREWESGERVIRSLQLGSYQVFNKRYEKTCGINRDQLSDDATGALIMEIRSIAQKVARHPDTMVSAIFSANPVGLDGVALFHATHQRNPLVPDGSTYTNIHTTRPLTRDNLAYVRAKMRAIKGPDGLPLRINPRLLIVPPALEDLADRLASAQFITNTDGATPGAGTTITENHTKGRYEVLVIDELEDISTEDWYLADVSAPDKPFIMQPRDPMELTTLFDPDDPFVFKRNEYVWGATVRYGFGPGSPYRIAKGDAS